MQRRMQATGLTNQTPLDNQKLSSNSLSFQFMAFNWKTFRTRTLTAIIFAAVMLAGLLWNQWSFLVLFSIIHFGCWWEFLKLVEKIYNTPIDKAIKYFFCVCGYLLFLAVGYNLYDSDSYGGLLGNNINLKWFVVVILVVCLFAFLLQNKKLPNNLKWLVAGGLLYISLSLGLMISLRNWGHFDYEKEFWNKALPLGLILSIWTNDTMAYIVGSLIGKTPFSKISPKKTWEGTIGGIVLCIIVISAGFFYWWNIFSLRDWISISAIAAVFGTLGDLLESKLKRMADVKDSGNIMPGHGGFLDRFDSLLLAIPAVWIYVFLFMK